MRDEGLGVLKGWFTVLFILDLEGLGFLLDLEGLRFTLDVEGCFWGVCEVLQYSGGPKAGNPRIQ